MKNNNKAPISVRDYFAARSVFITGATGFVGKVLVEKLLRICDDLDSIFVLIRPKASKTTGKKGQSAEERLQTLLENSIFDKLRKENPNIFRKVIAVSGDISWDNLGISKENQAILSKKVSVIFHLAATVKFNESLETVLNTNVGGTQRVADLSKTLENLSAVVHVSTAYSNADLYEIKIQEVVYPSPCDPRAFLESAAWLNEIGALDQMTDKILGSKPNTYVFSKHLAENLIQREAQDHNLPACIVRPSIVSPVYKDPIELKGWVDNLMGFSGFLYAIGHGLNYISLGDKNVPLDLIPVDFVVNIIILAAWDLGTETEREEPTQTVRVYNACVDQFNPITNEEVGEYGKAGNKATPFNKTLRPPSLKLTQSHFWFIFLNFFAVGIPCFLMDCARYLICQKPKLYRTYENVNKAFSALAYFRTRSFHFSSDNVELLRLKTVEEDKADFDVDLKSIKWPEYVHECLIGLRKYYDKDDDESLPEARKNATRLKGIYWTAFVLFTIFLLLIIAIPVVMTTVAVKHL